jgi:hypothetical protein
MTLEEACRDMQSELQAEYDLGPGDAKDLFEAIWQAMVRDIQGQALNQAVDDIAEKFQIGF